ncbi:MXAN_6640 family putative metalloprotease [Nocardioides coralli]|uniref:MXAN_6640 family putative metalloprotease n=1 Tax=Nocardioides coralli TaxID=2872154 RepID=UPI001CA422A6|nr:MXAN_6640 family putative metalloprotease [Nocardioides coralli]QZY30141.1 hypothetical protein K6T13_05520 [Nocardioides coralli]
MRRTAAALVAVVALLSAPLGPAVGYADDRASRAPEGVAGEAERALALAEEALAGDADGDPPAGHVGHDQPEATIALRDLFRSLPQLEGAERRRAERMLARPTEGAQDPYGDGYRARSVKTCNGRICVHRVKRTRDRATAAWARRTLTTVDRVWSQQVGKMGYRRPLRDGRRGGNAKFDVYLADVGDQGLFGYCAPELTKPGNRRLASGYCVLDNDFARSQYAAKPVHSLRVTAAHEFFHAVQFAYDYLEDPWLMEATATWMEERFADAVNDNRRYLPQGQVARPDIPLDYFDRSGTSQYGNWAFVEHLTQRFGTGFVRKVWREAGNGPGDGRAWSTRALEAALPRSAPFARTYLGFLAANVVPARSYPEGKHWPSPRLAYDGSLGRNQGVESDQGFRVRHLAGYVFRVRPARTLDDRRWQLRVRVDGPARKTGPRATVVRRTASGALRRTSVALDGNGDGVVTVPFNRRQTSRVWVVVANTSTRFDCRGKYVTGYSCGGRSRDDDRRYAVTFRTTRSG